MVKKKSGNVGWLRGKWVRSRWPVSWHSGDQGRELPSVSCPVYAPLQPEKIGIQMNEGVLSIQSCCLFSLSQIMHTEQPTLGERVTKKAFLEYSHKTLIAWTSKYMGIVLNALNFIFMDLKTKRGPFQQFSFYADQVPYCGHYLDHQLFQWLLSITWASLLGRAMVLKTRLVPTSSVGLSSTWSGSRW